METFIYIIKSIAILSIFYIIYRIVLQKDTFFSANRHYLLSGIIAALVIPFIEYTKTIYREIPILNTPIIENASLATTAVTNTQPQQEAIPIDWWQIALIIYGIGFAIMMIRLGIQLISLHRLIIPYPKTYKDGYAYVQITDKAIAPFSFFKTICYNPNLHSPKELDMILAHEKIHVRQRHTLDILLTQCILTIQWFNPLAWLYKKSLEQNLEFIADNGAIQEVPSSQEYQRTLVKVSSTILQPALTNNFYHSLIKKRIVMLNKQTSSRRNLWKLGLVLPALALFMYSFNIKEVIEYREVSENAETAFAKAETNSEKKEEFYINNKTTASQLDAIENHFTTHYPEKRIKFDNRVFHKNGYIRQFSFQTKFPSEKKFFTRFEVTSPIDKDGSGYLISNADKASIQVKELGNDGVTFNITKEQLVFDNNAVKQHPVFVINDKTSDSELNTIETFFEMHYPKVRIKINDVERDSKGVLTHYTVKTIFEGANSQGAVFENNDQNIKKGISIHYEEGPAIVVKQLEGDNINVKSIPNEIETNSLKNTNLTNEAPQLLQSLLNNTNATSENTQSLTSRIQDATNNIIKETNNSSSASESQVLSEAIKKRTYRTQGIRDKEMRVLITKNTSEKELKALQEELKKDHNLNLNYSTSRNNSNEITSINISYSGNNKTGSYNISGDEPITDFYFYMKEEGDAGFWSEAHERRKKERHLALEERQKAFKERRQEIEEKREEIRSQRNNEGKELQERREKMEERMLEHKEHINERKEEMKMRRKEMKEEMHERKEEMKMRQKEMKKHLSQSRSQQSGDWDHSDSESITITKNTTDDQIRSISSELKSQGITFSLTKVKRNSRGEITGYKMKFNNNNGTESVSQKKTNSDSPIETLHIVYNDGNIQVHN